MSDKTYNKLKKRGEITYTYNFFTLSVIKKNNIQV